jgi:hypothetical protein
LANRRGFLSRLVDSIKEFLGIDEGPEPEREDTTPPQPPREPPQGPPSPQPDGGDYLENRLQRDYQDIVGTQTGFYDWLDMFDALQVDFDDDAEHEYFWDMFLRSFYLDSNDAGMIPRDRFYRETGITKDSIDWQEWRDVMGYSSRK